MVTAYQIQHVAVGMASNWVCVNQAARRDQIHGRVGSATRQVAHDRAIGARMSGADTALKIVMVTAYQIQHVAVGMASNWVCANQAARAQIHGRMGSATRVQSLMTATTTTVYLPPARICSRPQWKEILTCPNAEVPVTEISNAQHLSGMRQVGAASNAS